MDLQNLIETLNFTSFFWQIITPIIFSILDIVTGFIVAVINNNVDSKKMREGLWHKMLLLIILSIYCLLDLAFSLNFCSKLVSIYLIVMELVSIAENLSKAGIDLGKITTILKKKGE